ncbi:MAG: glycosyltransferase [bacterium]
MNKHVLLISYYFPPTQGIGTVRPEGTAKYLEKLGYKVTVLTITAENSAYIEKYNTLRVPCPQFLRATKQKGFINKIKRFFERQFKDILFFPDDRCKWIEPAVKAASELIEKERPCAIISSSSPYTVHVIAHKLKEKFNIPWIADLRDPWSQTIYYDHSFWRRPIDALYELKILGTADVLTVISDGQKDFLQKLHKTKNIKAVTNGFDPEKVPTVSVELDKKLSILFAGTFYLKYQKPELFFEALGELIAEGLIDDNKIEVNIYTGYYEEIQKLINNAKLEKVAKQFGRVDHETILQKQRSAQVLWLCNLELNKDNFGCLPGKMYEYLTMKRPILLVGGDKNDELSRRLKETGVSYVAHTKNEVKSSLLDMYKEFEENGFIKYKGIPDIVNSYSHEKMAEKFASIIEEIQ